MPDAPAPPIDLEPLPDAARMRATDAWAIERLGIEGYALMRSAGGALADAALRLAAGRRGPVLVVCGAGNNGGDGYVAATWLRRAGLPVEVRTTVAPERLSGDAARARADWPGPLEPWTSGAVDGAAVIVDAILGTGARGAPRDAAGEAIAALRGAAERGVPVVACDLPSGVDATTGEVPGEAVRATVTVTFHRATSGLWIAPGKDHVGRLEVVDIGIPARVDAALDAEHGVPATGLLGPGVLEGLARRDRAGTKFRSGHVVVCGGAPGMTGAPCLSARGAMRTGAGYATLAVAGELEPVIAARAPVETLTLALPTAPDGGLAGDAAAPLLERLGQRAGTLVVGPGLGRGPERDVLVRRLAAGHDGPLLVDADGLSALAGDPEALRAHHGPAVVTPHAGELARLLDVDGAAVGAHRLAHAREAARRSEAVVVLKGDDTLVVAPDGRVAISPGDAPGLATAGTGDVLSGVIGALLARGADAFHAAAAGVWLHLVAGRRAAAARGVDGVVAGDVAEELAAARHAG